jgi:hypothetical protein
VRTSLTSAAVFAAVFAAPVAGADVGLGPSNPKPTKVFAPGIVASIVFGDEPAFAVGLDGQYIAFDTAVSSMGKDVFGRGLYAQSQLYLPFGAAPMHLRHSVGVHALHGVEIREQSREGAWTQFRFGGAFRHAAGDVAASYGPEAQPVVGAGEYALVWLGLRFTPPVERALSTRKSHGWETALSLGFSLPFGVGGWPYGAVS